MTSVAPREQRVRCIDGSWHLMKMMPYVTAERMIRGLVIEFVKTTPPSADSESDEVHPLAQLILSALPQPMVLIDRQLRLVWANRSFFETFSASPAVVGRSFAEAWGSTTEPAELWVFLEELVANRPTRDILIEHPFGRGADRPMRFSGRVIYAGDERPILASVFMHQV
jgi:two-component system CheB/CheR fusion protein